MARAEIVRQTVIQGQLQHMSAKQLLNFKDSLLKIEYSQTFQKILHFPSQNFVL
jgi:hypothetical protein